MDTSDLTITASFDGGVCVLTARGELDGPAVPGLLRQAAPEVSRPQVERLVLDLGGLSFLDVTGARALAAVTWSAPPGCPVIVRAVSPPARRVLGLVGLNLERPACPAGPQERPAPGTLRLDDLLPEMVRVARLVVAAEERLAATLDRMAGQYPEQAARLEALSRNARRYAGRGQRWLRDHDSAAARSLPPARH